MTAQAKPPRILHIDTAELAVRIIETITGVVRPVRDPRAVLDITDPTLAQRAGMIANVALAYVVECMQDGGILAPGSSIGIHVHEETDQQRRDN